MYEDPEEPGRRLIVPQIVANSAEVVRAVVRVETTGTAHVDVTLEDATDEGEGRAKRHKLSEDEFFSRVPDDATAGAIRALLEDARELGAITQMGSSSVSVRLKDPNGARRRFTLFVVKTNGELFLDWLYRQLKDAGYDEEIAETWAASIVRLIPGVERHRDGHGWLSRNVMVGEIKPVLGEFIGSLTDTIEAIRSSAARASTGSAT